MGKRFARTLRAAFLADNPVLKDTPVPAMPSLDQIQTTLWGGKANAFGPNSQRLLEVPGQAVEVASGDSTQIEAVIGKLDETLASDFVNAYVARAGLHGAGPAPPRRC